MEKENKVVKKSLNEIENHQKPKESDLVENLKNYLETTSKEEIQKAWDETKELDLVGPTMEEYLNSFKKYNGFFDEAWNIYQISVLEKFEKDTLIANYAITNLDDFITRIITDEKFAREWGFQVDVKELDLDERMGIYFKMHPNWAMIGTHSFFDSHNIPTKSIKITYNRDYNAAINIRNEGDRINKIKIGLSSAELTLEDLPLMDDKAVMPLKSKVRKKQEKNAFH